LAVPSSAEGIINLVDLGKSDTVVSVVFSDDEFLAKTSKEFMDICKGLRGAEFNALMMEYSDSAKKAKERLTWTSLASTRYLNN
jgi:hypothetical protein